MNLTNRQIRYIVILLFFIFLISRISNLIIIPMFNDEAIYINWGQIMISDDHMRFYSLFDGKQPLLMWLFGLSSLTITNPLYAGRIVTVIFSMFTFLGIYKISKELFKGFFVFVPLLIYTITPLFLFFDRQALMEGALNTCIVWSFYSLLKLTKTKDKKTAIVLGLILGLGFFVKSSMLPFIISSFVYLVYKTIHDKDKQLFGLVCIILITMIATLFPLLIQSNFSIIVSRGDRFTITLSEIINLPILLWLKNSSDFIQIAFFQLTPPLLILAIAGIIFSLVYKKNEIVVYWFLVPLIISIITLRGFNTRYAEIFFPIIIILISYAFQIISNKHKYISFLFTAGLLIPSYLSFLLITNPIAYFDILDRYTKDFSQKTDYVTGNTSGYQIHEVVEYLEEQLKRSPILVGVRLDAGNPENAMHAYFFHYPNIHPIYFDRQLIPKEIDIKEIETEIPLYFVSRSEHRGGLEDYLTDEKLFYKPEGKSYFGVYKFDNQN